MPEYPLFFEAGLLIVYARLGGPRGGCLTRLALDTGATTTMIPTKAALAIGSNPAHATRFREVLTASGKELIPMIVVPRMKIFQKTLLRITVACHELPSESPIDGLLGLDILDKLNAAIDIPNRSIRIL
jgi:predicted aspartyl protease